MVFPWTQKDSAFDLILDACLGNMSIHRLTIANCLAEYPDHARELEPLLEMALTLSQSSASDIAPGFRRELRRRFCSAAFESLPTRSGDAARLGSRKR